MVTRSIIRLTLALIIVGASLLFVTSITATAATTASAAARPQADLIVSPGESIQAAIDAANDGDTILINAGDYTESLKLSKPVSLTGVNSDTTIIHAIAGQRVLAVTGVTIGASVVISGLTFTGGSADYGGGLYADPEVTLINMRFISNTAAIGGGALTQSGATISNSQFIENQASTYSGGGLACVNYSCSINLYNTSFLNNAAAENGGGLYSWAGSITIAGSRFEGNFSHGNGGGLIQYQCCGSIVLTDTQFISNTAMCGGGAFAISPVEINGGRFERNTSNASGGALCLSAATLTGTEFISNTAADSGGGLYASEAVTLTNVEFISNTAFSGGGIYSNGGLATIKGGRFERNVAVGGYVGGLNGGHGGGLVAANLHLIGTSFISNSAGMWGGGLYAHESLNLSEGRFEDNRAAWDGGGVFSRGDSLELTGTQFFRNSTHGYGSGMSIESRNARIVNALFIGHKVDLSGAAIYLTGGQATVVNSTFADPLGNREAAILNAKATLHVTGIIAANHLIGIYTANGYPGATGFTTEDYNLFYGNLTNTVGVIMGAHSLVGDPRFVDAAHDDYHLASGSAALDHGIDAGIYTDLDGNLRPQGLGFDIGAYEFTGGTRYVATTGDDASNLCLDQLSPCATVQHAIDVAHDGEQVLIASGLYTEVNVRPRNDITTTGVVTQVAYLSKTLTIRGGYTVTNWLTPNLSINQTVLDAQAQGRVFYITGNISLTLEGLRLTNGTGILSDNYCEPFICYIPGGAIYAANATVELIDSIVDNNAGGFEGAAIFVADGQASLRHNVVMSNTAGGVTLFNSDGLITDNQIIGNTASNGGGIMVLSSTATLLHNDILSNTAFYACGGGVCIAYGSTATVNSNVIRGNRAMGYSGGGVEVFLSQAVLRNNLIEDNFVNSHWGFSSGGGVSVDATSRAELIENTIRHNVVSGSFRERGGGVDVDENSSVTLTGNLIEDNAASQGGGLSVARLSNATVANNLFVNNVGSSEIHLEGGEAHLLHNTLAGNASSTVLYVTSYQDQWTPLTFSTVALTNTLIASYTVGVNVSQGNTVTLNSLLWHGTPITVSQTGTATVIVHNEIYGDPRFVDPAHDDYRLALGSAAIDHGVDAGVYTDLDGNLRPQGAGFDIGAYEYQGPIYRAFLPVIKR